MAAWEYCAIGVVYFASGSGNVAGLTPLLGVAFSEFTASGTIGHKLAEDKLSELGKALGAKIAQLGSEGWEMVGCGVAGQHSHILYFKRMKP